MTLSNTAFLKTLSTTLLSLLKSAGAVFSLFASILSTSFLSCILSLLLNKMYQCLLLFLNQLLLELLHFHQNFHMVSENINSFYIIHMFFINPTVKGYITIFLLDSQFNHLFSLLLFNSKLYLICLLQFFIIEHLKFASAIFLFFHQMIVFKYL